MPCDWSPDLLLSLSRGHRVSRRWIQVPKDQQKLLERSDAWDVRGTPKVPAQVLEELRRSHVKEIKEYEIQNNELVPEQKGSPSRLAPSAVEGFQSQPSTPGYEFATQIDAATPDGQLGAHDADDDSEDEPSDQPLRSCMTLSSEHLHPQSRFKGQDLDPDAPSPSESLPEVPVARPLSNIISQVPLPSNIPHSSLASEASLDIEVPKAATDTLEPVNLEATSVHAADPTPAPLPMSATGRPQFTSTPPSAQIIPSTIPTEPTQTKRNRLMKPPAALFNSRDDRSNSRDISRLGPGQELSGIARSPNPELTSSALPTSPSRRAMHMQPSAAFAPGRKRAPTAAEIIPQESSRTGDLPVVRPEASPKSSDDSNKPSPNKPPSQAPYTAFKVAYPDFRGTETDFVRAIIIISKLQRSKELPEFLYDDFVRVFCSDYLDYISAVDGKETPLPTIKWYNENVSEPRYTKKILNKQNIHEVKEEYPNQVRAIECKLSHSGGNSEGAIKVVTPRRPLKPKVQQQNDLDSSADQPSPELDTTHRVSGAPKQLPTVGASRSSVRHRRPSIEGFRSASREKLASSRSRVLEDDPIDSSLPEVQQTQTPNIPTHTKRVGLPGGLLSQQSNFSAIPESTVKPKSSSRKSIGAREPGRQFKKRKQSSGDQEPNFVKYLRRRMAEGKLGSSPSM